MQVDLNTNTCPCSRIGALHACSFHAYSRGAIAYLAEEMALFRESDCASIYESAEQVRAEKVSQSQLFG
jgi:hypothetical protein